MTTLTSSKTFAIGAWVFMTEQELCHGSVDINNVVCRTPMLNIEGETYHKESGIEWSFNPTEVKYRNEIEKVATSNKDKLYRVWVRLDATIDGYDGDLELDINAVSTDGLLIDGSYIPSVCNPFSDDYNGCIIAEHCDVGDIEF
ncbi:hypothetical protein [Photobacterium damselae]|uniref:hypothetical protein n=1 Tax=Photobacterium damselae TaxID=38293 RepID=UPI004068E5C6